MDIRIYKKIIELLEVVKLIKESKRIYILARGLTELEKLSKKIY